MSDYKEPEGTLVTRERGITTLKQCGWCIYASGSHRYNYCISGHCSLQKSYSKEVHWDDNCIFLTASKSDIDAFINSHEYEIKSCESSINSHLRYIKELKKIREKSHDRPPLPDDRKYDHFNIGDDVAVFLTEHDKWYFGNVAPGYRHHDGCVSYVLNGIGPQGGKDGFGGCGVSVPIVMLRKEYDFFSLNPKEYDIWCDRAYNKSFNGKQLSRANIDDACGTVAA